MILLFWDIFEIKSHQSQLYFQYSWTCVYIYIEREKEREREVERERETERELANSNTCRVYALKKLNMPIERH